MKRALSILALLLTGSMAAYSQIELPQPSPAGSVSSVIGLTEISVDYFRPKMRDRQIFGEGNDYLVPFGQLWRTGANNGSVVTISDDVKVGDKALPAGKYLILTVPGASSWEWIFYKDISMGGNTAGFTEDQVALSVKVTPTKLSEPVEVMTFNISDISEDNTMGAIELAWENTSVKVGITVDFDSKIMAEIERNTRVNPQNYVAAANYYFSTGRDLDQAIEWMEQFLPGRESQFWNVFTYAQMLMAKGDYEKAKQAAQQSMDTATNSGNDFGYVKRNKDLIAEIDKKIGESGNARKKKK